VCRGGGKKRKKKNYTTPKKIKHKHRKVKLAVLKYYKAGLEKIRVKKKTSPVGFLGFVGLFRFFFLVFYIYLSRRVRSF
jgi:small subunit ribosomal protein S27Ae